MNPAATIVIPLKRQPDGWLEQCVRSAVGQSAPCETLVVYTAETPSSNLEILHRIARERRNLRAVLEDKPGSFPGAINLGIRLARANRIGLLLSDDWLDTGAVAKCLPLKADIVSTGNTVFRADGVTIEKAAGANLRMPRFLRLATLEQKAAYLQHFFLFRKQALLLAGGLDETIGNYPGIDDYDLIWTLLERGASVGIVEQQLYNYRDHEGERLTLAGAAQAGKNFEKILIKHRIPESDIPAMVGRAAPWFGKPIYRALPAGPAWCSTSRLKCTRLRSALRFAIRRLGSE